MEGRDDGEIEGRIGRQIADIERRIGGELVPLRAGEGGAPGIGPAADVEGKGGHVFRTLASGSPFPGDGGRGKAALGHQEGEFALLAIGLNAEGGGDADR